MVGSLPQQPMPAMLAYPTQVGLRHGDAGTMVGVPRAHGDLLLNICVDVQGLNTQEHLSSRRLSNFAGCLQGQQGFVQDWFGKRLGLVGGL